MVSTEVAVGRLELAVRFEEKMIPDPDRVKPQLFRHAGAVEDKMPVGEGAEMGKQYPELHPDVPLGPGKTAAIRPYPGLPTTSPSIQTSDPRRTVRATAPFTFRP